MHRAGSGLARSAQVLGRVEVGRDLRRFAGSANVRASAVVPCDHGDGIDPQCAAGAEDPQRDLAAVRYEKLL
jgi:hypothetical protein